MDVKRVAAFLLAFGLGAGALAAQWRAEAARAFTERGDFRVLADAVEKEYPGLPAEEKADAAAVLAFCRRKGGEASAELRWMVEYFETGEAKDTGFTFLDYAGQGEIIRFLDGWKAKYPHISAISLIKGVGDEIIIPEGVLPLVVEISNRAYYKFAEGSEVVKGGELQPGFNVIGLDANHLFAQSKERTYYLEVKAGDLILKKEIILKVDVSWPVPPRPKPPEPPKQSRLSKLLGSPPPVAPPAPIPVREYTLSMYVGGDLIMSSQKSETVKPLTTGIKPFVNPEFRKPDWNIKRTDPYANPMYNSFSIFDAVGILYNLLKNLFKKSDAVEPARIKTVQDLTLDFKFRDADANPLEMKVDLKLRSRTLPVSF